LARLTALIFAGLALASACRSKGDDGARDPAPQRALERGDHVVVEASAAEFFEARISEVRGDELRVQAIAGKQSQLVATSDVYRIPASGAPPAAGLAICRVADARWIGCRVDGKSAERIRVTDWSGASHELGADRVLSPTPLTELNLKRAFEQRARQSEFTAAVQRAGRPHAPVGWRPQPRQRVIARDGKAWYAAKIHEIEDERLHVAWKADARITDLPKTEVVPEPPHGAPIARGAIVLVRPETEFDAWMPLRVQASGNEIIVENADGDRRTVTLNDVVPLSP
jgi:hypothetical protein